MCFYIRRDYSEPVIAEHNILCFKILEIREEMTKRYFAPFRGAHEYKFGQLNRANLGVKLWLTGYSHCVGEINEGLHAFMKRGRAAELAATRTGGWREFKDFPAIIPAGSKFYTDKAKDELVADQLIVFENLLSLKAHFGVQVIGAPVMIQPNTRPRTRAC